MSAGGIQMNLRLGNPLFYFLYPSWPFEISIVLERSQRTRILVLIVEIGY